MKELFVRDAALLALSIRKDNATTCCCHIVVDDSNIDDASVAFCIQQSAIKEHSHCLQLALMLAKASLTQRKRIHYLAWQ